MARRNVVAALALLAFGAWYAWLSAGLPERHMPNTPGPSFFPLVIVTLLVGLALALLIKGIADLRSGRDRDAPGRLSPGALSAVTAFLVYLGALPFAGFVVSSVIFFAVLMVLYGGRKPLLIGVAATLVPVALFVIFRYGFQIVLPHGVLGF
ncbi:MAG: tripartite tricarboxylate transporter TctB family protein [Alphaproteobacteria bacterium]|nr:tripartite tricarboxylate transporter TctB family protein [Alphaproteobacteria bacterium]